MRVRAAGVYERDAHLGLGCRRCANSNLLIDSKFLHSFLVLNAVTSATRAFSPSITPGAYTTVSIPWSPVGMETCGVLQYAWTRAWKPSYHAPQCASSPLKTTTYPGGTFLQCKVTRNIQT